MRRVEIVTFGGEARVVHLEGVSGGYVMTPDLYQREVRPRLVAAGEGLKECMREATAEEVRAVAEVMRWMDQRRKGPDC